MPARPPYRIDALLRAFLDPRAELARRPLLGDVERRDGIRGSDPSVPTERQRRRLDEPAGEPVPHVAVEAPQPIHVDGMGVYPDILDELCAATCLHGQERGLIDVGKVIAHTITPVSSNSSKTVVNRSRSAFFVFSTPGW